MTKMKINKLQIIDGTVVFASCRIYKIILKSKHKISKRGLKIKLKCICLEQSILIFTVSEEKPAGISPRSLRAKIFQRR